MTIIQAGYIAYGVFIVSWNAAMLWTARARSKASPAQALIYVAGYVVGFGLLFTQGVAGHGGFGFVRVLPAMALQPMWRGGAGMGALLLGVEVAAVGFAWWARVHLGRLWSGMMTLREGHRVVDSGPYGLVRHPIYTGFIGASWALALLVATPAALAGAAVLTLVMAVKARAEEGLLRRELGPAAYDAYAAQTPMLVPFAVRKGVVAAR